MLKLVGKEKKKYFNPRPRKEGDDAFIVDGYIYHFISIHALVKRATGLADSSNGSKGDFNPRPRKEGDRFILNETSYFGGISIHALVKRATTTCTAYDAVEYISIHALVKRATVFFMIFPYVNFISIHALVKRATLSVCKFTSTPKDFNPRPRKEGDLSRSMCLPKIFLFQSTPS